MAEPSLDVHVRSFQSGDEAAMLEVLDRAFGGWPRVQTDASALDHLRWKLRLHIDEPHRHILAFDGQRVAGVQHHALQDWLLRGRAIKVLRGWDAGVIPEYRGRNVMNAVRAHMLSSVPRSCAMQLGAFTDHPAMLRRHEVEGRGSLGATMLRLIAPLTVRSAAAALKLRPGRTPRQLARSASGLVAWAAVRARPARTAPGLAVREVTQFDERVDALTERAAAEFDLILARTRSHLGWRYADPRAGRFTIKLAEDGDRLLGYVVLRSTNGRHYIADLLVERGRDDVVEALASAAVEHFRREGADAIACLLPWNHPYRAPLRRRGFVAERKRKIPLSFLPFDLPPEDVTLLAGSNLRLHILIGDSDLV